MECGKAQRDVAHLRSAVACCIQRTASCPIGYTGCGAYHWRIVTELSATAHPRESGPASMLRAPPWECW
eukprot:1664064-Prymnesium_polylepis.1